MVFSPKNTILFTKHITFTGKVLKDTSKKTVLVTGAAGFIGFHLALNLQKQGHVVIAVDNFNDYYDVRLKIVSFMLVFMIWNDLPADIHTAPSLMSFRSRLKAYLFEKAYSP